MSERIGVTQQLIMPPFMGLTKCWSFYVKKEFLSTSQKNVCIIISFQIYICIYDSCIIKCLNLQMKTFVRNSRKIKNQKSIPYAKASFLIVIKKASDAQSCKKLRKVAALTKQNSSSIKSWMLEKNIKRTCTIVSIKINWKYIHNSLRQ